jgi:hypothetical protein
MKRTTVAFLAGIVVASGRFAGAAATARFVTLRSNDHAEYAGVDCKATDLGSPSGRWLTCLSRAGWRYSVIYGRHTVSVFRGNKIIFSRH